MSKFKIIFFLFHSQYICELGTFLASNARCHYFGSNRTLLLLMYIVRAYLVRNLRNLPANSRLIFFVRKQNVVCPKTCSFHHNIFKIFALIRAATRICHQKSAKFKDILGRCIIHRMAYIERCQQSWIYEYNTLWLYSSIPGREIWWDVDGDNDRAFFFFCVVAWRSFYY